MTTMRHNNEDAIAYSQVMLVAFCVLLSPVLYLLLGSGINFVLASTNNGALQHPMSEQSLSALSYQQIAIGAIPLITLLGMFVWTINAGVTSRNGGQSTFQVFSAGWLFLLLCLFTSFFMTLVMTIYFDQVLVPSANTLVDATTVAPEWLSMSESSGFFFINAAYLLTYLIPFLGIGVYVVSILRRTAGDRYV